MKNTVLIFDTETTGLPLSWNAPMTNTANWPRVIQLAWAVFSPEGEKIKSVGHLVKPDGWVVPGGAFWKEHGYSTERCEQEGKPLPMILKEFMLDFENCSYLVAHNLKYDRNVLGAEMVRYKLTTRNKPSRVCTKEIGTEVCKIRNAYGYKWPKLSELHTFLFGQDFDGAHDAVYDVEACARCYFELKRRNLI